MSYFRYLALTIISLSISQVVFAQGKLEMTVAQDLQALVDETVNEGEQTAKINVRRGAPLIQCKVSNSKQNPQEQWVFCRVEFVVRFENLKALRVCPVLYKMNSNQDHTLQRADKYLLQNCIATLSEGIE